MWQIGMTSAIRARASIQRWCCPTANWRCHWRSMHGFRHWSSFKPSHWQDTKVLTKSANRTTNTQTSSSLGGLESLITSHENATGTLWALHTFTVCHGKFAVWFPCFPFDFHGNSLWVCLNMRDTGIPNTSPTNPLEQWYHWCHGILSHSITVYSSSQPIFFHHIISYHIISYHIIISGGFLSHDGLPPLFSSIQRTIGFSMTSQPSSYWGYSSFQESPSSPKNSSYR